MTYRQYQEKAQDMRSRADRIMGMRIARMRRIAREAGLDPMLLGIHPHNAWLSFRDGKPWPEVDYSKLRLLRRVDAMPSPHRIVDRWHARVWPEVAR